MTQIAQPQRRDLMVVWVLIGLAIAAALVAAVAGLTLVIAAPESGSSTEATLGFTAAACGLSTAVFAAAAAIYAQVRNLWQYAPTWVRVVAWGLLAVSFLWSVWRSLNWMT